METKMMKYSTEQPVSPYRQQQTRTAIRKGNRPFTSKIPTENLAPTRIYGGPLMPLTPLSCPSSAAALHSQISQYQNNHQKPPLLPLPLVNRSYNTLPSNVTTTNKKIKKQTKIKTPKKPSKQGSSVSSKTSSQAKSDSFLVSSDIPLGPDPNELPKDIFRVFLSNSPKGNNNNSNISRNSMPPFDSIFRLAPPPSSLPLPKFSIRPKLSCNAEAGVNVSASDDLCRILRIR